MGFSRYHAPHSFLYGRCFCGRVFAACVGRSGGSALSVSCVCPRAQHAWGGARLSVAHCAPRSSRCVLHTPVASYSYNSPYGLLTRFRAITLPGVRFALVWPSAGRTVRLAGVWWGVWCDCDGPVWCFVASCVRIGERPWPWMLAGALIPCWRVSLLARKDLPTLRGFVHSFHGR